MTGYFRRAYSSFAAHVFDIPERLLALMIFIPLLIFPVLVVNPFIFRVLISANVIGVFAVSWDLLVGRTGQISLGHALFFGIGGYTTAVLFKFFGLPVWVTIPLATAFGTACAFLVGFPCLRVKGPYLALITMAFPIILSSIIKWTHLSDIFGAEYGIRRLPPFFPDLPTAQARMAEYYLTLLVLFISALIVYKIANSKTGVVFLSILDDELASKASGINITKYKLMAFSISGLFGSLAGCLQAHTLKLANPSMLSLSYSFIPIVVTFIGGIGTIYGPLVGSYIYYIIDRYILTVIVEIPSEFEPVKILIFSIIVIVFIIKWPRGIGRYINDKLKDLQEARDLDERGKRIWKTYKKK